MFISIPSIITDHRRPCTTSLSHPPLSHLHHRHTYIIATPTSSPPHHITVAPTSPPHHLTVALINYYCRHCRTILSSLHIAVALATSLPHSHRRRTYFTAAPISPPHHRHITAVAPSVAIYSYRTPAASSFHLHLLRNTRCRQPARSPYRRRTTTIFSSPPSHLHHRRITTLSLLL